MNPVTAAPPFRVLFSADAIRRRVHELARALADDLRAQGRDEPPCLVAVIEGARPFARLLQRLLPGQPPVHEIRAASYGAATQSSGQVTITGGGQIPAAGRDVVLLEDIVDTGRTMHALQAHFRAAGARSCRIATLLSKPSRRLVEVALDYVGFEIPDEFVLGFGMDLSGRYRELPDIVYYDAEVERAFYGPQAAIAEQA